MESNLGSWLLNLCLVLQVKQETLGELKKKYKSVPPEEAEPHWTEQYRASAKKCSHAYW